MVLRTSPIRFDLEPEKVVEVDGRQVVETYKNQKQGPLLIDLSHRPGWDIQDKDLKRFSASGLNIPAPPSSTHFLCTGCITSTSQLGSVYGKYAGLILTPLYPIFL